MCVCERVCVWASECVCVCTCVCFCVCVCVELRYLPLDPLELEPRSVRQRDAGARQYHRQVLGAPHVDEAVAAAAPCAVQRIRAHGDQRAPAERDGKRIEEAAHGSVATAHSAGVVEIRAPRAIVELWQEPSSEAAHMTRLKRDRWRRLAIQKILDPQPVDLYRLTRAPEMVQHAMGGIR